jgi:hypothetical protein
LWQKYHKPEAFDTPETVMYPLRHTDFSQITREGFPVAKRRARISINSVFRNSFSAEYPSCFRRKRKSTISPMENLLAHESPVWSEHLQADLIRAISIFEMSSPVINKFNICLSHLISNLRSKRRHVFEHPKANVGKKIEMHLMTATVRLSHSDHCFHCLNRQEQLRVPLPQPTQPELCLHLKDAERDQRCVCFGILRCFARILAHSPKDLTFQSRNYSLSFDSSLKGFVTHSYPGSKTP